MIPSSSSLNINAIQMPKGYESGDTGHVTDKIPLYVCLVFEGLCVALAVFGFMTGHPSMITQPFDADHKPCGIGNLQEYPYIYFTSPTNTTLWKTVCVASCPTKEEYKGSLDCAPNSYTPNCSFVLSPFNASQRTLIYASFPFMEKICLPEVASYYEAVSGSVKLGSLVQVISNISSEKILILISVFATIALSVAYVQLIQNSQHREIIAKSTIFVFIGVALTTGIILIVLAAQKRNVKSINSDALYTTQQQAVTLAENDVASPIVYKVVGIIFVICAVLAAVSFKYLWHRIDEVLDAVKLVNKLLNGNFQIYIISGIVFALTVVYVIVWIYIAACLYSSGRIVRAPKSLPFTSFKYSEKIEIFGVFHIISFFVNLIFLVGCSQFLIAAITKELYQYTFQKGPGIHSVTDPNQSNFTWRDKIREGVWRLIRFNLGSVFLGSILVTVTWPVKAVVNLLLYLIGDTLVGWLQTIKKYLQQAQAILDKFTTSAYVLVYHVQWEFIQSGELVEEIVCKQSQLPAKTLSHGKFFDMMGTLTISFVTTFVFFLIFCAQIGNITSPIAPTILVFIVSAVVSHKVMGAIGSVFENMMVIYLYYCIDRRQRAQVDQGRNQQIQSKKQEVNNGIKDMNYHLSEYLQTDKNVK